jgi:beta-aspartyl-peptidase (threonine type)
MMVGEGAETFAQQHGMPLVPAEYFYTDRRWQELQQDLAKEREDSVKQLNGRTRADSASTKHLGTVGCVALDMNGNLAAGTSTGGISNKRYGRVGDSPIIGAGTYANNRTCAVSATGSGEYFIRSVVAHDISALMEYGGLSLKAAAVKVVMEKLPAMHGEGGVIALDKDGNIAMPFNTPGMYRAFIDDDGKAVVEIYRGE